MVKNLAVEGIVPLVADRRGVSAVPNANARNMLFRVATAFRQQPSRSRVVKSQRVTMDIELGKGINAIVEGINAIVVRTGVTLAYKCKIYEYLKTPL
jgi:hypothetical protein